MFNRILIDYDNCDGTLATFLQAVGCVNGISMGGFIFIAADLAACIVDSLGFIKTETYPHLVAQQEGECFLVQPGGVVCIKLLNTTLVSKRFCSANSIS